jgi:hypothetical protein
MTATPTLRDLSSRRLPGSRQHWPAELSASHRDLVRDLDSWCRDRLWPSGSNEAFAEEAIHRAEAGGPWRRLDPHVAANDGTDALPADLRRWPADWRYRVAELERRGLSRGTAVEHARAELEAAHHGSVRRCA